MITAAMFLIVSFVIPDGELDDLPILDGGIKRISSYDRKEGDNDFFLLAPQQSLELADIRGPGTIKRFFIKVHSSDPAHLRSMVLRFYWENAKFPSVECPLGDFFALGHGKYYEVNAAPIITGNRRGMTTFFPMPFRERALMLLVNEGRGHSSRIYYQIDYLSRDVPENTGLFHAVYNQGALGPGSDNYLALHTEGEGKFVGLVLSVVLGEDGWFGSGDERIYVNGRDVPAVQGTGLDDFFGSAWGFQQGFSGPYFGTPVMGDLTAGSEFVGYRFHLRDPITFDKSIDVVFEHVGERYSEGQLVGDGMSRRDAYFSVAYWYQRKPYNPFNKMPLVFDRIAGNRIITVEGEQMPVAESCKERVRPEVVYGATVARFTPDAIGDVAEFSFRVSAMAWHEVSGFFTRSARHGTFRVTVDDTVVAQSVDFFKGEGGQGRYYTQRSDEIFFGQVFLTSGDHVVRFEALEPNEKAKDMLLGVDAMLFRPSPELKKN
jgi:hypothetical protein